MTRGLDADPPERQTVHIPAGTDGRIAAQSSARVVLAGGFQEGELLLGRTETVEFQRTGESRATRAVRWIAIVADPLRVVKRGEKNDDGRVALRRPLREVETYRRDMSPVILAVKRRIE